MLAMKVRGDAGLVIGKMAKEVDPAMARAVFTSATLAGGKLAEVVVATFPKGKGQLARSFLPATFIASSKGVAAGALSDLPHAGILDEGGTIYPKTVKMLAIPLSKKAETMWPRDWPKEKLVMVRSLKGAFLLVNPDSKKGTLEVHYLLKRSNKIKGRGYIDIAVNAIEKDVEDAAVEEMEVGFDDVPGVEKT